MPAVSERKTWIRMFQITTVVCLAAIAVCLICELIINRGSPLTWSLFVCAAVAYFWAFASAALIAKRHKIIIAHAVASVLLIPFLLVVNHIGAWDWFVALALPISLAVLAVLWGSFALMRYIKVNRWYKASIMVFLVAAANAVVSPILNRYSGERLFHYSDFVALIACLGLSVLLWLIGAGKIVATTRIYKEVGSLPVRTAPAPDEKKEGA